MSTQNTSQRLLSFRQIVGLAIGFLGIQYGFGLQQANLSPIFRYHGASEAELPILWLAGPITGFIIQPLCGAISDATWGRFGRRKPYFLLGALVGSVAVLLLPQVPALWMVVALFWIMDAAINTSTEAYRALFGDALSPQQRALGFSVQAFMIALSQILAGAMPAILLALGVDGTTGGSGVPKTVQWSFAIGVGAIVASTLWAVWTTKEHPPEDMDAFRRATAGRSVLKLAFGGIWSAIVEMPPAIRRLWWVMLPTWFAMPLLWQYLALSIARHSYGASSPSAPRFAEGVATAGLAFTVMNVATLLMTFTMPKLIGRYGMRTIYAACLTVGAAGFMDMLLTDDFTLTLGCTVLVGIGWCSTTLMPYAITAGAVPRERIGIYMGLINAFVCLPQLLSMGSIGFLYNGVLGGDPRHALVLAGLCHLIAAFAVRGLPRSVEAQGGDVAPLTD